MDQKELAQELKRRYDQAKRNETILEIDLFGIAYGQDIRKNNYHIKDIVELSGLSKSYVTEVTKGVKLSEYVMILPNHSTEESENE